MLMVWILNLSRTLLWWYGWYGLWRKLRRIKLIGRWDREAILSSNATLVKPRRSTRNVCWTLSEPSSAFPGTSSVEICPRVVALAIVGAILRAVEEFVRLLPHDALDIVVHSLYTISVTWLDHGEIVQLAIFNNILR